MSWDETAWIDLINRWILRSIARAPSRRTDDASVADRARVGDEVGQIPPRLGDRVGGLACGIEGRRYVLDDAALSQFRQDRAQFGQRPVKLARQRLGLVAAQKSVGRLNEIRKLIGHFLKFDSLGLCGNGVQPLDQFRHAFDRRGNTLGRVGGIVDRRGQLVHQRGLVELRNRLVQLGNEGIEPARQRLHLLGADDLAGVAQ